MYRHPPPSVWPTSRSTTGGLRDTAFLECRVTGMAHESHRYSAEEAATVSVVASVRGFLPELPVEQLS